MRSIFALTLESILLFDACILQLAHLTSAATSKPNTSNGTSYPNNTGTCTGCSISAAPRTLTFPRSIDEVTSSVTATVIPYITIYDNGTTITSLSTFLKYSSGATAQTTYTNPVSPLTWKTLGTTLTYPTTYLAFLSPVAGPSKTSSSGKNSVCYASPTSVRIDPGEVSHLIFPSTTPADHDRITASVSKYLDSLPTISKIVAPFKPEQCKHFIGVPQAPDGAPPRTTSAPLETSAVASLEPIKHTSVKLLTTKGQAVITRVPAEPQTTKPPGGNGGKDTPSPPKDSPAPNSPNGPAGPGTTTVPVLPIGGSTITPNAGGGYVVGGQTVAPGGPAVVVGGTTVSIAAGGTVAVVNGQTTNLPVATYTGPVATGGAAKLWGSGFVVGLLGAVGVLL